MYENLEYNLVDAAETLLGAQALWSFPVNKVPVFRKAFFLYK